jgi:hypothetical protein
MFEQLPLESPGCWLRCLEKVDTERLSREERRVHTYYMADAKRLLQEEQQREKWDRLK